MFSRTMGEFLTTGQQDFAIRLTNKFIKITVTHETEEKGKTLNN